MIEEKQGLGVLKRILFNKLEYEQMLLIRVCNAVQMTRPNNFAYILCHLIKLQVDRLSP